MSLFAHTTTEQHNATTYTLDPVLQQNQALRSLNQTVNREAQVRAYNDVIALNGIFALVEQMRAVDTSGVEPLNHPIAAIEENLALRLRDDVVTETNRRDDYQQVAPATQDGLYLVPKVIE